MNETFFINLAIGIIAGILAGMFGIGGGVVIVPALIFFAGYSITQANGTSLLALLLPVGIFAALQYYRNGLLKIKISLILAGGLLLGVWFGAELAIYVSPKLLKLLYAFFLLYVVWNFSNPKDLFFRWILNKELPNKSHDSIQIDLNQNKLNSYTILVGIFAGILSGMFGIGGGLVIVPFLVTFLHFDTKTAIGTSLGALLLPVGLPGVIAYNNAGHLNVVFGMTVALGLLLGAIIGAKITISLSSVLIKRVYSIFLLIISIYFIFQSLSK